MHHFDFLLGIQFWKAVLEIGIIAGGIYYALGFLRGTRGAAVLTGLAVILVSLMLVTRLLELDKLNWILSWFFGFFTIALLVIFQPELRRGLAELGSRPFFYSPTRAREVIDIICGAARTLSEKRIGALIAIEGTIGFRGIVERGVEMDCTISVEMLTTIFHPNTPLHDGGVVIRGDKIAAAACIFPLSDRRDLDLELGTRHRAALGLTEETDAVVVVVSEETGKISVVHREVFRRDLTPVTLINTLDNLLLPSQVGASRWGATLRRWLGLTESHQRDETPSSPDTHSNDGTQQKGAQASTTGARRAD